MNISDTLRVRIAEAKGWTACADELYPGWGWPPNTPNYGKTFATSYFTHLPNWPEDLNACAQFEAGLTAEQQNQYMHHLVPDIAMWIKYPFNAYWAMLHANARQRCLAYLATINPDASVSQPTNNETK